MKGLSRLITIIFVCLLFQHLLKLLIALMLLYGLYMTTLTESDMLVMGGYSRSRLRQRVFGGFTEYMLSEADIPVFMLHA